MIHINGGYRCIFFYEEMAGNYYKSQVRTDVAKLHIHRAVRRILYYFYYPE